jgi:general secretion pathway protein I
VVNSVSAATRARGFSLLEMVVAVAILGMSLGALYQAAGGATRTVAIDEKTVYAVELARSLLAIHASVPLTGTDESGETEGGFEWSVTAVPIQLEEESPLTAGLLQHINVAVRWVDAGRERKIALESVVAGMEAPQ